MTTNSEVKKLDDMFVVEWSEQQGFFHIDKLCKSMTKNIRDYIDRRPLNYVIIGIVSDEDEANDMIDQLEAERGPEPDAPEPGTAKDDNEWPKTISLENGPDIISLKRR